MNDKENMTDDTSSGSETTSAPSSAGSASPHEPPSGAAQAFADAHAGEGLVEDARPVVRWRDGELPAIVDEAEAALIAGNESPMFQRGPVVVRVVRMPELTTRNFKRPGGGLGIVTVEKAHLVEEMTRTARWEKWDGRSESWRRINAPETVAQTYLARRGRWKLPPLLGVISTPTLRPDGTVLQIQGYDDETATWYDSGGLTFPRVPDKPTQREAATALDVLVSALDTVPFEAPADLSVAVSLLLTALVRRSLPSAPLGAISATGPSSGKTLLADCISIVATGARAAAMSLPASDEEAQKTALTMLMAGDPVILIDNVSRPLHGDWLCTMITSETYQGRMLGRNEMITVPTTSLWLATGNKLVIQGDLRTRTLLCRIDPKQENPQERVFKEELKSLFRRKRIELVIAGLTLMRAYRVNGERSSIFRPWGRFEEWSQFCREPLMWLGLTDPCESYKEIEENDPERREHRQMLAAWKRLYNNDPGTARGAVQRAIDTDDRDFMDLVKEIAAERGGGGISSKRLGNWLARHDGVPLDKLKFARAGELQGSVLWRVADA